MQIPVNNLPFPAMVAGFLPFPTLTLCFLLNQPATLRHVAFISSPSQKGGKKFSQAQACLQCGFCHSRYIMFALQYYPSMCLLPECPSVRC